MKGNRSVMSLPKITKQIYGDEQLKETQRQFSQRLSNAQLSNKPNRAFIQLSVPSNDPSDIGFFSFSAINAENKGQIIESLKQFKSRQSWLKLSLKAQIAFNLNQYNKISEYCRNVQSEEKQTMWKKLKQMEPIQIKQKIKKIQKYKSAVRQTVGLNMRIRKTLLQTNKSCWKPYVDYDSVVVGLGSKIYFFGGRKQCSVGCYDVKANMWSDKFKPKKMKPFGQTHGSVLSNSQIIFFGGVRFGQVGFTMPTNNLQRVNLQTLQEQIIENDYEKVPARYYHAQCIYGQFLIISGGIDSKDKMFNNFMSYHIEKNYWNELPIAKKPPKLNQGFAKHKMIPVFYQRKFYNLFDSSEPIKKDSEQSYMNEGVYIFGGQDNEANLSNKVYLLKLGLPSLVIEELPIKGTPPKQRKNFAICKFKSYIIIHGGRNDQMTPYILQSVHCLNLTNLSWINVNSDKQFRRYSHTFCQYSDDQFLIMGGISTDGVSKDVYGFQFSQITDYN